MVWVVCAEKCCRVHNAAWQAVTVRVVSRGLIWVVMRFGKSVTTEVNPGRKPVRSVRDHVRQSVP